MAAIYIENFYQNKLLFVKFSFCRIFPRHSHLGRMFLTQLCRSYSYLEEFLIIFQYMVRMFVRKPKFNNFFIAKNRCRGISMVTELRAPLNETM